MRFRAIFASTLTVILLSLSWAIPQCQTKCDFAAALPGCHGSLSHQGQPQPMADMPGMAHRASSEVSVQGDAVAALPSCTSHPCAEQPPSLLKQKVAIETGHLASPSAAFVDAIQFAPKPTGSELAPRGPPRFAPASPVSLRTTLRV